MDSLDLAARYSFMPNKLELSSEDDTDHILFNYAAGKEDRKHVKKILENSSAFYLYLDLIARHNNKDAFDKDVIEAYWIGNNLLDNVPYQEIKKLILDEFTKVGMPKSVAIELSNKVPKDAVPHHSFHVFHVHEVTKSIRSKLTDIDKCRISWGKVRHIGADKLIVAYTPIEAKDKIKIAEPKEIEIDYKKELLPDLKVDDYVSIHWNLAIQVLTEKQVANMKKYTARNVNAMNSL